MPFLAFPLPPILIALSYSPALPVPPCSRLPPEGSPMGVHPKELGGTFSPPLLGGRQRATKGGRDLFLIGDEVGATSGAGGRCRLGLPVSLRS